MSIFDKPANLFTYGLPMAVYSPGYGHAPSYSYILEKAIANHYVMQYDLLMLDEFHPRREKMQMEWEAHMGQFAHLLVDYLLAISMGESRHAYGKAYLCNPCKKLFYGIYQSGRTDGMHRGFNMYASYPEAFEILIHIYYDHEWMSSSFGGWKWGNIVFLAKKLYNAYAKGNINKMSVCIDQIMQVAHNGGSALYEKFSFFNIDSGLLNRILWAKRIGKPCCYGFLRKVIRSSSPAGSLTCGCVRMAIAGQTDMQLVKPARPFDVHRCVSIKCRMCLKQYPAQSREISNGICITYCVKCAKCICKYPAPCKSCGYIIQPEVHRCKNWCTACVKCCTSIESHYSCAVCNNFNPHNKELLRAYSNHNFCTCETYTPPSNKPVSAPKSVEPVDSNDEVETNKEEEEI